MMRLLLIPMLIASLLPGVYVGQGSDITDGEASGCRDRSLAVSCCGGVPDTECGCGCVADSTPDPHPDREAPVPGAQRDLVIGLPGRSAELPSIAEIDRDATPRRGLVLALNEGLSHNEARALLGIWRT